MNKPITFQNSISNEEAALLPAIEFRGPIVVVDSEPRLREACRYLAAQPVIGFDTETRPSFRAGVAEMAACAFFSFTVGYADYPRVQALADRSPALRIERTAFGDGVTVFASAREEALPAVQTALRDALGGRISFADGGRGYAEV